MEEGPLSPGDKPRGGRPTKLTPDLALGIAQSIIDGMFRTAAGKRFGVSKYRLSRWMSQGRQYPNGVYGQFRQLVLESESEAERTHVANVCRAGNNDDWKASAWWLERKFPGRWGSFRGEIWQLKKRITELEKMLADEAPDQ